MDQKAIEDAGFDKGIKSVAKKLKKDNVDINTISEYTGLTVEEIQNLD